MKQVKSNRRTTLRTRLCLGGVFLCIALAHIEAESSADVPMTRPEECLAVVDGLGGSLSFEELPDGSIMLAHGGGRFATSRDGGLTWSEPVEARDVSGDRLLGVEPNLVRLSGSGIGYASRRSGSLRFWRSEDGGKTWQQPVRIGPPPAAAMPYRVAALQDSIIRTSSGRIILPAYGYMLQATALGRRGRAPMTSLGEAPGSGMVGALLNNQWISTGAHHTDPKFTWSFVYYSDDDGRSWQSSRDGQLFIWDAKTMSWSRTNEPSVVEAEPGKLLMYMRTDWGRLYKSWSFDNGETWTVPTPTPLASSGAPAQLRKIPATGDLLVVWNQHSADEMRKGLIRARLSAAVSRTYGAVWEFFQNVESALPGVRVEPGPIGFVKPEGVTVGPLEPAPEREGSYVIDLPANYCRCSYPSVLFHEDRVLISHSNAHYTESGAYVISGRLRVLPISWLYGGVAENMSRDDEELKNLKEWFSLPAKLPEP